MVPHLQKEEEHQQNQLIRIHFPSPLNSDLPHHVTHIYQRSILQPLLRKHRTTLKIILVQLRQCMVQPHTVIHLKKSHHFASSHSLVRWVSRNLVKKYLMNVHQQLALQVELLTVIQVVVLELLLLVSFSRTTYLGITVLHCRLLLFLLSHIYSIKLP